MKEINNDIKESYCSFEVSKLLKKNGCNIYGYLQEVWLGNSYDKKGKEIPVFGLGSSSKLPTHALAIEWIRVNFGIFIVVGISSTRPIGFHYYIQNDRGNETCNSISGNYKTPQEATEEALKYVLQNLISK